MSPPTVRRGRISLNMSQAAGVRLILVALGPDRTFFFGFCGAKGWAGISERMLFPDLQQLEGDGWCTPMPIRCAAAWEYYH